MAALNTSKTIFLIGGSGYIGRAIIEYATKEGFDVTSLSRSEEADEKLRNLGAVPIRGDITSFEVITRESAKADAVVQLVDPWKERMKEDYSVIIDMENSIIDAVTEGLKGTGKPLVVSSGSAFAAPNPNGEETTESSPGPENPLVPRIKREEYALAQANKGVRVVSIRLAPWVYGRGGSGVRLFTSLGAKAGRLNVVDEGKATTSSVHVNDAARLYLLAIQNPEAKGIYNATNPKYVTIGQIMEACGQIAGLPVVSKSFAETEATAGSFFAHFLSLENKASSAKAFKELGWQPKEAGIIEDITLGSYVEFGKSLRTTTGISDDKTPSSYVQLGKSLEKSNSK